MFEAPGIIVLLGALTAVVLGALLMVYLYYLAVVHLWPWLKNTTFELSLKTKWGQRRAVRRFDELQTYSPHRLRVWRTWLKEGWPSKHPDYAPLTVAHIQKRVAEWEKEHPPQKLPEPDLNLRVYQERL